MPQGRDEDSAMDPFLRNSILFRKKTFGSMLEPQRKPGAVCITLKTICYLFFEFLLKVFACFRSELVMMD